MTPSKTNDSQAIRWDFLDGIRGFAAFYVVFDHATSPLPRKGISQGTNFLIEAFSFGKIAVAIFIVLSGIVLALPYTKNKDRWDLRNFLFRRARRLLPPFYAAFLLSIPVSILYERSHGSNITISQIISHIFLVQHFNMPFSDKGWLLSANGPLWSVSVEWEIYLIYGFLLFQVWKKWGIWHSTILGILLSIIPLLFLRNYNWYYPSYIGLFSIGMALANYSSHSTETAYRPGRITILRIISALVLVFTILLYAQNSLNLNINLLKISFPSICITHDYLIGAFMIFLILSFVYEFKNTEKSTLYKILNHRISQYLGKISYSVYLIHTPILASIGFLLKKKLSGDPLIFTQILVGIPITMLLAILFHNLVEKPFLNKKTGT